MDDYIITHVREHYEVYDNQGNFISSADTIKEANDDIEEYKIHNNFKEVTNYEQRSKEGIYHK